MPRHTMQPDNPAVAASATVVPSAPPASSAPYSHDPRVAALYAALRRGNAGENGGGANSGDQDSARLIAELARALSPHALAALRDAEGHSLAHWAALCADDGDDSTAAALRALLAVAPELAHATSAAPAQAGQTPLHWAAVGGNACAVRALLLFHGVGIGGGRRSFAAADPTARDVRGATPALHAVHYGHLQVLHMLAASEPRVADMPDNDGHTPLHWAAHLGHLPIVVYLLRVCAVDPDARNASRATALHIAAERDEDAVVRTLLQQGADHTLQDDKGRTPRQRCSASNGNRTWRTLGTFEREQAPSPPTPLPVLQAVALSSTPSAATTTGCDNVFRLRYGNGICGFKLNRALARGVALFGSYAFVIFFHVTAVVTCERYYNLIMPLAPRSTSFTIVTHALLVVALVSCHFATFRDPGYVPCGTVADLVAAMDQAIDAGTFERSFSNAEYCFQCLAPRLPRSKHSRTAGRCIMRFDHFCPWVNADIGLRNHHALIVFPAAVAPAQWLFLVAAFSRIHRDPTVFQFTLGPLYKYPLLCALMLIHLALSMFALGFVVSQVKLICTGFTTFEYMTFRKSNQSHKPYHKGCMRNVLMFLAMTGPGTELPRRLSNGTRLETHSSNASRTTSVTEAHVPFLLNGERNDERV